MTLSPSLAVLEHYPRWINWRMDADPRRSEKPRKVPISPLTGRLCDPTDVANHCDYATAACKASPLLPQQAGDGRLGVGFVFMQGDGLWFLDLDNCWEGKNWSSRALEIFNAFGTHAACEHSQSGRGLHLIGWASSIPDHACKNVQQGLELYHHARFVALTDRHAVGAIGDDTAAQLAEVIAQYFPKTTRTSDMANWSADGDGATPDDDELIRRALAAKPTATPETALRPGKGDDKVSFEALWTGHEGALAEAWPDYGPYGRSYDASSADMSLAIRLAYWTGRNCERMERLMRRSALVREKWDDRPDYLKRTILNACAMVSDVAAPAVVRAAGTFETANDQVSLLPDQEPSEDTIAEAFKVEFSGKLRFDHGCSKWFEYVPGSHWRRDDRKRAFHYSRTTCRLYGAGKRAFCKASTADGVERFARADPAFATSADQWDADSMLLGTPGGTVDLRTGQIRPALPGDLITKVTSVQPNQGNPILWLSILNELFAGDQELIAFLKRFFGYALTGETREHALLFFLGPGGRGKSTILNTMIAMLGDYACTAAMETFMAAAHERHSTDLAMLRGARLVSASETEEGRHWAEARIKAITGGDPITARLMRQDNFTFRPNFKLIIAGNHPPRLRNCDEAMRRRLIIVPFNVRPAAPDALLDEKLRAELGSILRWCIQGCIEWLGTGLNPPDSVRRATDAYFEDQDTFGEWLKACCALEPNARATPTELYNSWMAFAAQVGEPGGDRKAFAAKLNARNFSDNKSNGQRTYRGIRLLSGPYNSPT